MKIIIIVIKKEKCSKGDKGDNDNDDDNFHTADKKGYSIVMIITIRFTIKVRMLKTVKRKGKPISVIEIIMTKMMTVMISVIIKIL